MAQESITNIMTQVYEIFVGENYDVQQEIENDKEYIVVYDTSSSNNEPILRMLRSTYDKTILDTVEDIYLDYESKWR
tara:strand:- start:2113 stop:2343 length:231 start_codon:yes stop_codon:yes gene_type:complete